MNKKIINLLTLASALALLTGCNGASGSFDNTSRSGSSSAGSSDTGSETNPTSEDSSTPGSQSTVSPDTDVTTDSDVTSVDVDPDEDEGLIHLADNASTTTCSSGVSIDGNTITISELGTYYVDGTLTDGNILITAEKVDDDVDTVELILNGASITCSTAAPIYSMNSSKLKVKKQNGSNNYVCDNRTSEGEYSDAKGAIFSNKKLSVVGQGSLSVVGNFKHGIASDKGVNVKNGSLIIQSADNGIKSKEDINIGEELGTEDTTELRINSTGGNGIRTEGEEDGFDININQGNIVVVAAYKGISANEKVFIHGGDIDVTTGGGSSKTMSSSDTNSYKGIQADIGIEIDGGDVEVDSRDDAVHTNDYITISGGTFALKSGDDGIHADNTLNITGGTISVNKSYEGLEAYTVNISGGTTYVVSSDDGVNAAGGSDTQSSNPWGGGSSSSSSGTLNISGGFLYIEADGDGLDSNGNIYVTGGVTVVSQSGGGNGPIDYGDNNNYMQQDGGFLCAYGSADMTQGATQGSQYSYLSAAATCSAGQYYCVSIDNEIKLVIECQRASSSLYVSDPSFTAGSATLTRITSANFSDGEEVFKGLYYKGNVSSSSSIASWTWSTSNVHAGSSSSGGGGSHGGGGGRPF